MVFPRVAIALGFSLLLANSALAISQAVHAPFIVSSDARSFSVELRTAVNQLPPEDRVAVSEAVGFLTFLAALQLNEELPSFFAKASDVELNGVANIKLHDLAVMTGKRMTLGRYIEVADNVKRNSPTMWTAYKRGIAR